MRVPFARGAATLNPALPDFIFEIYSLSVPSVNPSAAPRRSGLEAAGVAWLSAPAHKMPVTRDILSRAPAMPPTAPGGKNQIIDSTLIVEYKSTLQGIEIPGTGPSSGGPRVLQRDFAPAARCCGNVREHRLKISIKRGGF